MGICERPVSLGGDCDSDDGCEGRLRCEDETCVPPRELGEACLSDLDCNEALICGSDETCKEVRYPDDPCGGADSECVYGL